MELSKNRKQSKLWANDDAMGQSSQATKRPQTKQGTKVKLKNHNFI